MVQLDTSPTKVEPVFMLNSMNLECLINRLQSVIRCYKVVIDHICEIGWPEEPFAPKSEQKQARPQTIVKD